MAKVTKAQLEAKLADARKEICEIIMRDLQVCEYNGSVFYGIPWQADSDGKERPRQYTVAGFTGQIATVFSRVQGDRATAMAAKVAELPPSQAHALLNTLAAQLGVKIPHKG